MTETSEIKIKWHGRVPYDKALHLQDEARKMVLENGNDQLILLEHPPVYTFGKSADHSNLLIGKEFLAAIGATAHETERGGDITFHGPGQLVGYPIIHLNRIKMGARSYVERLEESLIRFIAGYGLTGYRIDGLTGIWVKSADGSENKIGAIGIKISRGITMHGFALNLNTDLKYFGYINPCGILDKGVTSIQKETGKTVDMQDAAKRYSLLFEKLFYHNDPDANL